MQVYDIGIVGAGPCGSYLAGKLARLGYTVVVLEKKSAPEEDICCTGIVSQECLELLDIPENLIFKRASSAKVISPSGRQLRLWRNDVTAYVIDRPSLDRVLAERAMAAGARFLFNICVTAVQPKAEGVDITAESYGEVKTCRCRAVVLATGFGSSLPSKLGLGWVNDFTVGAQAEAETNIDEIEVYLDTEMAPGGFAWLVPTKEHSGLVGLMTRHQPGQRLSKIIARLKSEGKIAAAGGQKYGAIPLRPLARTFASRVLVVGEAAGQVKPLTGGGIYFGTRCADVAARVLDRALRSDDFSELALSRYHKEWWAELGKEIKFGYRVHRFYQKMSNRQVELLCNLADRYGIAEFVNKAEPFPFDRHSKIIFPALKYVAQSILSSPVRPHGQLGTR